MLVRFRNSLAAKHCNCSNMMMYRSNYTLLNSYLMLDTRTLIVAVLNCKMMKKYFLYTTLCSKILKMNICLINIRIIFISPIKIYIYLNIIYIINLPRYFIPRSRYGIANFQRFCSKSSVTIHGD